ncbi:hypothetical protein NDR87_26105 [Nocardia sp. CDC159]|uniref:Uncharacterized protein n=1 Tax=Nocardia pulmonis TaxID=2951408 RepID=A0A9X2E797_9NOCA|nr:MULTISPECIES: hypothetical protein [Nocardia]MCM6774920.1 hypothetical protein [Nocardia pulmonis]MCM6789851.1 hypothetical protein [Nocardia sp. CDC159]
MTDRTAGAIDAVPEADYMEQTVPAYPDLDDEDVLVPSGEPALEASEADVLEQSIAVPLDDDYEDTGSAY